MEISSVVLHFSRCLSLLPGLLSCACILDVITLRMSSLLIVLVGRWENHWVLTTFQFIQDYSSTQFNGREDYWDHLQVTLAFEYFHSSLLHWIRVYLHPTLFIGRILPSSHLSQVRHDLGSIQGMSIIT